MRIWCNETLIIRKFYCRPNFYSEMVRCEPAVLNRDMSGFFVEFCLLAPNFAIVSRNYGLIWCRMENKLWERIAKIKLIASKMCLIMEKVNWMCLLTPHQPFRFRIFIVQYPKIDVQFIYFQIPLTYFNRFIFFESINKMCFQFSIFRYNKKKRFFCLKAEEKIIHNNWMLKINICEENLERLKLLDW